MNHHVVQLAEIFLILKISSQMVPQEADRGESAAPTLKVDTSFVWVPTVVRSVHGTTVRNISADRFQLWDDGVSQRVVPVNTDDFPTSLIILCGLAGSLALARVVDSMLYGLKADDPATFLISAMLLIVFLSSPKTALRHVSLVFG